MGVGRTALRGESQRRGAEFADLKTSGEEERGSGSGNRGRPRNHVFLRRTHRRRRWTKQLEVRVKIASGGNRDERRGGDRRGIFFIF
jgi:hypothetical protein